MLVPVILCGGKGTRLWPLSREDFPKQFMEFTPGKSLFRETIARLGGMNCAPAMFMCANEFRFTAAEQIQQSGATGSIILEPVGRNTAPAAAVAALNADPNDVLLIMPADHLISDTAAFQQAVEIARKHAQSGQLVCLGSQAETAETGYGYIKCGQQTDEQTFAAEAFVEKPDQYTAVSYIASKKYLWNTGIFVFQAGTYLSELEKFAPDMIQACKNALTLSRSDLDFIRLHEESFAACPADSIDFAVMEKTDRLCVVTMDAGWSDQGSWATLHATGEKDSHDNVCVGDVAAFNSSGNYLHSSGRLLMAVGVENAVVVETPDAVLVASNDHSQELKSAVESLRQNGRVEAVAHPLTRRPWGSFQSMDKGERFQVKRITVKPGEILSLQKHRHRAEHWVVVKGLAQVVNGDREMILRENESTYIPVGSVHRLGNPGETPLELIEVQTGSYLGEDDIIRLEDKYNRDSD